MCPLTAITYKLPFFIYIKLRKALQLKKLSSIYDARLAKVRTHLIAAHGIASNVVTVQYNGDKSVIHANCTLIRQTRNRIELYAFDNIIFTFEFYCSYVSSFVLIFVSPSQSFCHFFVSNPNSCDSR